MLLPRLAEFTRNYPDIVLEVTSSNDPVAVVGDHCDAGIQISEFIQREMIAVRVSKDMRLAALGSPEYFAGNISMRALSSFRTGLCW